ncbi:MAG: hypothetical protein RLZZ528_636 [Pseudomonadota bacterium]|jgi:hypothetical protein
MPNFPEPGQLVRMPGKPEWGLGQVQSNVSGRVTVNFEHAGKVVVNIAVAELELVFGPST